MSGHLPPRGHVTSPRVPHQPARPPRPEVVALLACGKPARATVLRAAQAATARALPLDLVVVPRPGDPPARALVSTDRSLQLVRRVFPHQEVRVHVDVPDPAAWLRAHTRGTRGLWVDPGLRERFGLPGTTSRPARTGRSSAPGATPRLTIAVPPFRAVLFDLDGVLTGTAALHEQAWARLAAEDLGGHRLTHTEYLDLVDGRNREQGLARLVALCGVAPDSAALTALAARKDGYFCAALADRGPRVLPGARALAERLVGSGVATAVVSASRNARRVLAAADLLQLFDEVVDGVLAAHRKLPGKPDPALFLEAARRLGCPPDCAVVVEDSRAGLEAGRRGGFGLTLGIGDGASVEQLCAAGADLVVPDLEAVDVDIEEEEP